MPSRSKRLATPSVGGHARAAPGTPGDGGAGEPEGAAVRGEPVEEGVGRRVRALAAVAPDADDGGEGEEQREVQLAGRLVQVLAAGHLGAGDLVEGLPGEVR